MSYLKTDDEQVKERRRMSLDAKKIARLKKIASGKTTKEIALSEGVSVETIHQFKHKNKEDVKRFI